MIQQESIAREHPDTLTRHCYDTFRGLDTKVYPAGHGDSRMVHHTASLAHELMSEVYGVPGMKYVFHEEIETGFPWS